MIIKKITILGIVTYFFLAHPMFEQDYYVVKEKALKQTNPLLGMGSLYRTVEEYDCQDYRFFRRNTSIRTDRGLALILTAVKFLGERDEAENEKTLQTIRDAVSDGIPVISNYAVSLRSGDLYNWLIEPSQKATSIFESTKDCFGNRSIVENDRFDSVNKERLWMKTVFQGHRERQKQFDCICDESIACVEDELEIETPKSLMSLIFSFVPEYHINEESTTLIEQAKSEFDVDTNPVFNTKK